MSQQPAAIECIARGLILRDGAVLLCRNVKHGHCYLPGGHIEPGEAASDAFRREMLEETGVEIDPAAALLVHEERFVQRGKPRHEISVVFHVEHSPTGEIASREAGIEFLWAAKSDLEALDIRPPSIASWLRTILASGGSVPSETRWMSSGR